MATTEFVWDMLNDNYLMEQDGVGVTTAVYTNAPATFGELVSQDRSGSSSYYHFDGLGSTRSLTDGSENVTDTAIYSAFGNKVVSSGSTPNPFRHGGVLGYYTTLDDSDQYIRSRTYTSHTARFLSVDPLLRIAATTSSHHGVRNNSLSTSGLRSLLRQERLYVYSGNNPLNVVDPSGLVSRRVRQGCSDPSARPPLSSSDPSACQYPDSVMWVELFIEELRNGSCKPFALAIPGVDPGCDSRCRGRYAWRVSCVCKEMSDNTVDKCVRGCLQCLYDTSGTIFPNADDHGWCINKCTTWFQHPFIYLRLKDAIERCIRSEGRYVPDACGATGQVITDEDRQRMEGLLGPDERSPNRCCGCDVSQFARDK